MVVVKLLLTSLLSLVFDPDYIIHLQNNSTIHVTSVALMDILTWVEGRIVEPSKYLEYTTRLIQETIELNTLFIQIIKMFHISGMKMHRRPGVKISYMVCDWFCMENGGSVLEKCLSIALIQAAQQSDVSQDNATAVSKFFNEVGHFLSLTGVCESLLTETQCTKRTINCLTTIYLRIVKSLLDFASVEVTKVSSEGSVVADILDCLLLKNGTRSVACINPHVIWDDLLNLILLYSCKGEQAKPIQTKVFTLLESYLSHHFGHHSDNLNLEMAKANPSSIGICCSLTDSDSAFYDPTTYASDTSMEEKAIGLQKDEGNTIIGYTYLEKYRQCLSPTANNEAMTHKTLQHINNFIYSCPIRLRSQFLKSVLIPTLEELSGITTRPLSELQAHLVQNIFLVIEKLVSDEEALSYCCTRKKLFKTILRFSSMVSDKSDYFFADDALRCAQSLIKAEIHRVLKANDSLSNLGVSLMEEKPSVISSNEVSRRDSDTGGPYEMEQNGQQSPSSLLSSTDVVNEFLVILLSETENLISRKLSDASMVLKLKKLSAMWRMHTSFVTDIPEYANFSLQTSAHGKLCQGLIRYLLDAIKGSAVEQSEELNKIIISVTGHLFKFLSSLSMAWNLEGNKIIENPSTVLREAMELSKEIFLPISMYNAKLAGQNAKGIMKVLFKAAIQPINEKDLDQDDENIEHQSDQSVLGPGCTSNFSTIQVIHDIDSGYDPDRSEEEKSDQGEIDKKTIDGIIRASYRRKKITNKEILNFIFQTLIDDNCSMKKSITLENWMDVVIDVLSRALDLVKGVQNIDNR